MRYLTIFFALLIGFNGSANSKLDSLLSVLDKEMVKKDFYMNEKFKRIDEIKRSLPLVHGQGELNHQFDCYERLYGEYKSFIYDSAFYYAVKTQEVAFKTQDRAKIALSRLNMGFVLTSSGMFKEAFDTLSIIPLRELQDSLLLPYYSLKARAYMDLIGYNGDKFYLAIYSRLIGANLDSAINHCVKDSPEYLYQMGLKSNESGNLELARSYYEALVKKKLDPHFYAMASSSLAWVYMQQGQADKGAEMLVEAIKADIVASTKETVATHRFAEILYDKGYISEASTYIKIAMNDASFYKSNFRKKQLSATMPLIEGRELSNVEGTRDVLFKYSVATTILSLLVVFFLIVTYRTIRELKRAKKIVSEANNRLMESNKIKDEYIGHFFSVSSDFIEKIEKFKKAINRKMATRRFEDIEQIVSTIDLRREREELYSSFDKIFLKLFPDFVKDYNSLFKEEDRVVLKDDQLLNTDLRIFALIRLGINDTESISKILEYSVNTIYAYKTRIKNKSIVANDLFEQCIMDFKTE